jgi:multiple sugar transport system permease protein
VREARLGWLLCAPMLIAYAAVAGYPIVSALWLSLHRYDLRFAQTNEFVGLENYGAVLASPVWWQALGNTLGVTAISVACELFLGLAIALTLHRVTVGRGLVRAAALVPYSLLTVVAALAWKFAFDPTTGFVAPLPGMTGPWFAERWSAFVVVILTEIWKTTPFVALLLLAGLAQVPDDVLKAARVDGASSVQTFWRVTLPLLRPAILTAMLFRLTDALRIFDTVYVQTRGGHDTETISIVAYQTMIVRLNLGLGAAVAVLVFLCVLAAALVMIRAFGASMQRSQ